MCKNKQKNKTEWNTAILSSLAARYNFSERYIKQCITGDRTPVFADEIKKEYRQLEKEINELLNTTPNKTMY